MPSFYVTNLLVSYANLAALAFFQSDIHLLKSEMLNQIMEVSYKAQIIPLEHAF